MELDSDNHQDRRRFLKTAGLSVGATLWAVPTMQIVHMASASAQTTGSVVVTPPPSTSEGPEPLTFTPVNWTITLDADGPGIHTVFMLANVSPLTVDELQDLGGKLVWDETQVILCSGFDEFIQIRGVGDGYLQIGDGFESNEQGPGCSINAEMADAFARFGLPQTACLYVKVADVISEYCAPLTVIG